MQVSSDDLLALADRAIDTAEDIFMHASRAFAPAEAMNLPLTPGDEPLTATKKPRIVVLGTGWGGHAISKVGRRKKERRVRRCGGRGMGSRDGEEGGREGDRGWGAGVELVD